jgi:hypothetical protein
VHGHPSAAKDWLASHDVGIVDDQAAGAAQLVRGCGGVWRGPLMRRLPLELRELLKL